MNISGIVRSAVFAAIAALALAACVGKEPATKPDPATVTTVRVAQTGDFLLYAGLYVALDSGAFERGGLKVAITNTGGDEKSAAAVLSGNAEFGIGDPTFAAIAKGRGQDLRVVSALVGGAPFWGITYDPAVVAKYASTGLRDLRVATFPAPSTAYTLQQAMFQSKNLEPTIVPGAFGSLQGILEAKQADVALELEPNVSMAQQRGATVLYSMSEANGDLAITGAVVSGTYAKEHPEVVAAFCTALGDGLTYLREHTNESEVLLAKRFPELPAPVISSALKRMLDENIIPASPRTDREAWKRALALRVQVGDIADAAAVEGVLDNSFCN